MGRILVSLLLDYGYLAMAKPHKNNFVYIRVGGKEKEKEEICVDIL